MSLEALLLGLEEGFWASAGRPDFYREHLAEQCVFLLPAPAGALEGEALLAAVASARPWAQFRIAEVRLVPLGEGTAGLVYRGSGRREGEPPYHALVTSIYRQEPGGWKLVLHQQTPSS